MVKRRILSRARCLAILIARQSGTRAERDAITDEERDLSDLSALAYMLADGQSVKIYNDRDMGGPVVEYEDK